MKKEEKRRGVRHPGKKACYVRRWRQKNDKKKYGIGRNKNSSRQLMDS